MIEEKNFDVKIRAFIYVQQIHDLRIKDLVNIIKS
jgi:hypothetical protein